MNLSRKPDVTSRLLFEEVVEVAPLRFRFGGAAAGRRAKAAAAGAGGRARPGRARRCTGRGRTAAAERLLDIAEYFLRADVGTVHIGIGENIALGIEKHEAGNARPGIFG